MHSFEYIIVSIVAADSQGTDSTPDFSHNEINTKQIENVL